MKRPSAPTDAAACRQLLTKALTHAPEYRFRLSSLCHALQLSERKLWQLCQDCFGQTPKALMDWARAKTFLQVVELEPELKLRALGKRLGFESESAFNRFAHRVFGGSPQQAKEHRGASAQALQARYEAIEAWFARETAGAAASDAALGERVSKRLWQTEDSDSGASRVRKTRPKRKTESENRIRKPKRKTETENRIRKPKRKTESENRNGKPKTNFLEKTKKRP
ncbi:MAG: helix-turn-helix domain-containing protein, partial [Chloroherpetonaceae bacterium]|nr:helix-turn-helix domain-containing protein [Chloroherpetonaceae bacterium]